MTCRDLERSIHFYERLGLKVIQGLRETVDLFRPGKIDNTMPWTGESCVRRWYWLWPRRRFKYSATLGMRLTDFKVLTFDCYGTLIDWESGMTDAYRGLVARSGKSLTRDQLLETHARYEAHQEAKTPTMPYSEFLGVVHSMVAREWGVETTADEDIKFGSSVPDWPAFPDSADALQYLKAYYKLVILSNVDRESFKGSNTRLRVEFDHIFTAQDIGSYKPNQRNFDYMIAKLAAEGIRKEEILHTAESLFHDHAWQK